MLLDVLETMFFSGLQKNQRKKTLAGQKFRTPEVRVALLIAINCNCSIKSNFLFIFIKQVKILRLFIMPYTRLE